MKYPKTYFDSEGIERGFYVYAHACRKTGTVFYVGRGKGKRAWAIDRNPSWRELVTKLADGYEVRLLHQDLTEAEAVDREREEIEAHGGAEAEGGRLTNWLPGDCSPEIAVGLRIEIDLYGGDEVARQNHERQEDTYSSVRKFKELSPADRVAAAKQFATIVGPPLRAIESIIDKIDEKEDCDYPPGVWEAMTSGQAIESLANDLERCRKPLANVCYEIEDEMELLELHIEEAKPRPRKAAVDLLNAAKKWFGLFDTGNREEALDAQNQEWVRQGGPETLAKLIEEINAEKAKEKESPSNG